MHNLPYKIEVITESDSVVLQTVLSGVLVFVVSQIVQKFLLEPIKEYKAVVGKIDNELKYYADIIMGGNIEQMDQELVIQTSRAIRKLSCDFESKYKQIPFKKSLSYFGILPTVEIASKSAKSLMRVSNAFIIRTASFHDKFDMIYEEIKSIRDNLKIPEL